MCATRLQQAAFRIEIGNEGWNFPTTDPYTTVIDFINGVNGSGYIAAKQVSDQIFQRLGAQQFTRQPDPSDPTVFEADDGELFQFFGAGHIVGTYRMGSEPSKSVVDREQRSWNHKNLFLVGSGVFPTVATANPTLTIAALALWAADTMLKSDLAT